MSRTRNVCRVFALAVAATFMVSCAETLGNDDSSSYLVVLSMQGASGARPATFGSVLGSDVLTIVTSGGTCSTTTPCPTIFNDLGQAVVKLTPKNPSIAPTAFGQITINRYRVVFRPADGVSAVPAAFEGA